MHASPPHDLRLLEDANQSDQSENSSENVQGEQLYLGLMSGTSLDGVDAVLVDFSSSRIRTLGHAFAPFDASFKQALLDLNTPGPNELHRAHLASNQLARLYAQISLDLLARLSLSPQRVKALGAHGQTVRHQPQAHDDWGYTTQLLSAHLLAELTGMDVIHDFRSRDLFAGGQGAPLVPAFHHQVFSSPVALRVVLNIGGMSNVSILPPLGASISGTGASSSQNQSNTPTLAHVAGFDCGPGNVLLDLWCEKHTGKPFDENGQWAREGQVQGELLQDFLDEPFFHMPPPKSTGRDLFNADWLNSKLTNGHEHLSAVDVQATLCALTAHCILLSLDKYLTLESSSQAKGPLTDGLELVLCGGGALNATLVHHLQEGAKRYPSLEALTCLSSELLGCAPQHVEAVAFAWLARQRVMGLTANLPWVTGAKGTRVLGSWVRASAQRP